MDAGTIAVSRHAFRLSYPVLTASIQEFDTPANLFAMSDGIFRGMCERSFITLDDIISASTHPA